MSAGRIRPRPVDFRRRESQGETPEGAGRKRMFADGPGEASVVTKRLAARTTPSGISPNPPRRA